MNIPVDSTAAAAEDVLLIVPVRNVVLFPGVVLPISIGRDQSLAAAQEAVRTQRKIGLLLQTDPAVDTPTTQQVHKVGTAASIVRFITAPDGTHHLICQGERRFRVLDYVSTDPFLVARVEYPAETTVLDKETEGRGIALRERSLEALSLLPQAPAELTNTLQGIESVPALADVVASFMDLKAADKQELLATFNLKDRLDRILNLLARRIEALKVSRQIDERTQSALDGRQKEIILRERLRQIKEELGEGDAASAELKDLRAAIAKAGMPTEVEEQALRELARLERMPDASGEYSMVRNYLDWEKVTPVEEIGVTTWRGWMKRTLRRIKD